jgi:hypothetical protein
LISHEERLRQAIQTVAAHEYHKLVLLVGDFSSGKTQSMRRLCDDTGGAYLNVNLGLTSRLVTIDARTYATRASRILQELCDDLEPGRPLFLDTVELFFSLEVGCPNPVDLFKKMSRERLIILSLPCRMNNQARRGQRIKDIRKEAVLAGFAQCYRDKRFHDILRVGRKLHRRIVESSTEIYDFIDIAEAKVE